ncbi:MAG: zf-HC2 domain-containing protein [Deltaproteobacteria bacterium]|nr:zf-HC2 domain-containing protein [Deltaproteobacteria bacterium]
MTAKESAKSAACAQLEQDLVLLHYGELVGAEKMQVAAHVEGCPVCADYLKELADLLPKTVLTDEPPHVFWQDYNRELRQKMANLAEGGPWWRKLISKPWSMPVLATSAVVALALTFTFGNGFWRNRDVPPPVDEAILEVLPMAENLDFFRNLEVLDALELLELMGEENKGAA